MKLEKPDTVPIRCGKCVSRGRSIFTPPFTMAFQPIYDCASGEVFAHEALLRSPTGGGAYEILSQVTKENRYGFDQSCRVRAIELAAQLGMTDCLSINFMPNAVYDPDHCIQATLWAADKHDFPIERIIFEFTEGESIRDTSHLRNIVTRYKARGFRTAIDDFGAGYAGLNLLADVQPDIVKIDMDLIRRLDMDWTRRSIVAAIRRLCDDLGITVIAEGIETEGECAALIDLGIMLQQGYLHARPQFEALADGWTMLSRAKELRAAG